MRILIGAVAVAAALWSGYWFYGRSAYRTAVEGLITDLRAQGIAVSHGGVSIRGFPNRFDTTISAPRIADPSRGLSWHAPFLQVMALSYQPYRLVIVWPGSQRIETPGGTIAVTAEDMRASLALHYDGEPQLGTFIVEAGEARISGSSGWASRFADILAAVRHQEGTESGYEIAVRFSHHPGAASPPANVAAAALMGDLTSVDADLTAVLDRPIGPDSCKDHGIKVNSVHITSASLRWRRASIRLTGRLEAADGRFSGALAIEADSSGLTQLINSLLNGPEAGLLGVLGAGLSVGVENGIASFANVPLFSLPDAYLCQPAN